MQGVICLHLSVTIQVGFSFLPYVLLATNSTTVMTNTIRIQYFFFLPLKMQRDKRCEEALKKTHPHIPPYLSIVKPETSVLDESSFRVLNSYTDKHESKANPCLLSIDL